ncbi:hypothetical protein [Inconstantimicrobium mannanitabidum]|uniref:Uncharacterized protein n=1 Tax=Inconstantimicrobium mannanitabidum TaxID=1604901 RepID=A0ACB5RE82_9CLOT|nr:hypothetical protein [Clostridium sp. TW13]GKX67574.1 hypothetical protein rsdtw13_28320 [Clostridium sp. TW13]
MSITEKYQYYEKYGHIRYFYSDRCWNNESLKKFNHNKILARELVTFDCGLMDMQEVEKKQIKFDLPRGQQLLAVIIRPEIEPNYLLENDNFIFCGYDLVEATTYISAITNCGAGYEEVISYKTLNEYGLISAYREAVNTQLSLSEKYPDENHAYCEIVEIWRMV